MHALKPLVFATLLTLSGAALACGGNVMLGTIDSGVSDRAVNGPCVNDLIVDTPNTWGNHGEFVSHVSKVTLDLMKARKLSAVERSRIMKAAARSDVGRTLTVKVIAFNDFHGYIKAREGSSNNPGAGSFAFKVGELRAANPLHALVSAGDLIGASPLTSALFKDEPTIEIMNRLGLDVNVIGNHELDEGKAELLRIQHGGNHPSDAFSGLGLAADLKAGQFAGAKFPILSANVIDTASGKTLLPAYRFKSFLGNKVAFVGATLRSTPTIVSPSGVEGLTFADEADSINALVPAITAQGTRAIVAVIHQGGNVSASNCVTGPIVEIVNRLHPEVDLVLTGHTHQEYNCLVNNMAGKPVRVTSSSQYARRLGNIDLTLDTASKNVLATAAVNVVVPVPAAANNSVPEDASVLEVVNHYDALAAVPKSRVIGKITSAISRSQNSAGESALGDVIADAQLDATDDAGSGQAVVAFMNPGGIRANLPYNLASAGFPFDGAVTYGDAFTVQPFGNSLVTMTLTGAQIKTLLETQFNGCNGQTAQRILQVSAGFNYAYTAANACNNRVTSMSIHGIPVNPAAAYRVTVNSFLADGGDSFAVLKDGTDRLGGAVDTDAFEAYLQANPAGVAPGPRNRITRN